MKKILAVAGVVAVVAVFLFAVNSYAFKVPGTSTRVPGTSGSLERDIQKNERSACTQEVDYMRNSIDWNSTNVPSTLQSKYGSPIRVMRDDRNKSGDRYKRWEAEFNYKNFTKIRAYCTKDKCTTLNCYTK